ncbi:MAG: amidophosphoribosyltransferase, partial [Deltaproteobacteria bacterium]
MSDSIHHECGIAMVRLLKPLEFYLAKYGTAFYGLNKLHLLMQKQHNRGQDGAGVACIKYDMEPGTKFINRIRSVANAPIQDIFNQVSHTLKDIDDRHPQQLNDIQWLKQKVDMLGELYLGHLRYGTFGKNSILNIHPFVRVNNWMTKNLVLAGNFNLTNVDELFEKLIDLGQYPVETSDTVTILEKMGHFLDEENEDLYQKFKMKGFPKREVTLQIAKHLNVQKILRRAAKTWDGGYVIAGMFGHGDAFVMRDPSGIRPAYYYKDEEIVVVTSERPVIQTAFNVTFDTIHELTPGHALVIKKDGKVAEKEFSKPLDKKSCSFERIYFSRGNDATIYADRKLLGEMLVPQLLDAVGNDLENTVVSFVPNTAETAFYGFMDGLRKRRRIEVRQSLVEMWRSGKLDEDKLDELIMRNWPRSEKIAHKDIKSRTFIAQDKG